MNIGSRSEVKGLIKKGLITVNGEKVTNPDRKTDETTAVISFRGKEYRYQPFVYYMMNKPHGVVSATEDPFETTVLDILKECLKKQYGGDLSGIPLKDIFPVGRLDKDTVGLLLLTNNGELAHDLLSPKKHVEKSYYVQTDLPITEEAAERLIRGVDIGEKKPTKQAKLKLTGQKECIITVTEGKYHQIKRMFRAVALKVIYLKRLSMGSLVLDENLPEGSVRELTQEEVSQLC